MISNACATMRTARSFLPLLRPFIIKLKNAHIQHGPTIRQCHIPNLSTRRSTMGIWAFLNCFLAYRPAVWGR